MSLHCFSLHTLIWDRGGKLGNSIFSQSSLFAFCDCFPGIQKIFHYVKPKCQICWQNSSWHWSLAPGSGTFSRCEVGVQSPECKIPPEIITKTIFLVGFLTCQCARYHLLPTVLHCKFASCCRAVAKDRFWCLFY